MSYQLIKLIHLTAVSLSILGFLVRGLWMMLESSRLQQRWVRIIPHIVDTVLLISAIAMALKIHQYPFVHSWLTAKVIGLLVYIVAGMVALTYGKTKRQRLFAFFLALISFAYIMMVAMTKNPLPF